MTRLIYLLGVAAFLASCGADGMPSRPEPRDKSAQAESTVDEGAETSDDTVSNETDQTDTTDQTDAVSQDTSDEIVESDEDPDPAA